MLKQISVVIIVKNGAKSIKKCLDALVTFGDVVIYDNGSTDGTQDICRMYGNVNLIEGEFDGFGPTKNRAASFAENDWILSLDSDEVLTHELLETLEKVSLVPNRVYTMKRVNHYKNIEIKYCWSNDTVRRLYHRKKTAFDDKYVHEGLMTEGFQVELLQGPIRHYSYHSISEFIQKADKYSTLFAEQYAGKKSSTPFKAFTHSTFAFIKTYFIKRGLLDGYAGLVISYSQAVEKFYKYMKLYEKNIALKEEKLENTH